MCALGSTAYTLSDDAAALVESLPGAAQKVRDSLRLTRGTSEGPIQKVQRAAEKLVAAAEDSGSAAPAAGTGVTQVLVAAATWLAVAGIGLNNAAALGSPLPC